MGAKGGGGTRQETSEGDRWQVLVGGRLGFRLRVELQWLLKRGGQRRAAKRGPVEGEERGGGSRRA